MTVAIAPMEVRAAAAELGRMRRALVSWLKYRSLNDQVMAGTARVRKPLAYAQRAVSAGRDMQIEQDLADKLHALLSSLMPDHPMPNPDLSVNPQGAVQLAHVALQGGTVASGPSATGSILGAGHPWLWPVLIVGGLLLVTLTAIKTQADLAAQREQNACIEAGACTDYGFWLKAGGALFLAWFAWEKLGVQDVIRKKGGA